MTILRKACFYWPFTNETSRYDTEPAHRYFCFPCQQLTANQYEFTAHNVEWEKEIEKEAEEKTKINHWRKQRANPKERRPEYMERLTRKQSQAILTGGRLDAWTYTFAHPIWRTTNAARKQGAISPILPAFCKYYLCDAMMLIKLSMVWQWITGITTLEVAIVVLNFARDARMNTVKVCRMRERIEQDARTSLLMRERTHIVHWGSFY